METNTSNYAYGTVLSQKQMDGQHHPIGFMSKSMSLAEWNYGIPDKRHLQSSKDYRTGDTGWSALSYQCRSSQTTRIWNISQNLTY
jgi:hypothetical protein